MKKLIVVATLAALAVTPALAADMAMKAPPPARTPAESWAGCYVGVNGGYGWNNGRTHYNDPNTTADPINFGAFSVGTAISAPTPSATGGAGGLGGGGAGCNWQSQQWVYGLEADIDGGRISGSQSNSASPTPPPPLTLIAVGPALALGAGTVTAAESSRLNWLSTVRGRVGFLLQERLLLFASAGVALGGVSDQGSVTAASIGPARFIWSGSHSATNAGLTVGGGGEWAFAERWTAKVEYLWYDLGNGSHPLNCTVATIIGTGCGTGKAPAFATLGSAESSIHGSIVRFGINYRFN